MPPPGSGLLVAYIIRVLDGFVQEANSSVQITQRITEAFKHAYGHRTDIGDPRFTDITEVNYLSQLQNLKYVLKIIYTYLLLKQQILNKSLVLLFRTNGI